jgi:mannose-1-phosphate guanylyltransferase
MSKIINVILCGGVGSRLWPLSRKECPKQYVKMFDNKSLLELTIERNLHLSDQCIVVGSANNHQLALASQNNYDFIFNNIIEATPRNTAPAIAFASLFADPDDILLVTPSDHVIDNPEGYNSALQQGIALAGEGSIVTFGIIPSKPETGYGYIEYGGVDVISFREKPDIETAETFVKSGNFLWNSGMFCFKAGVLLAELEKYNPELFQASQNAWKSRDENGLIDLELSMKIPSISIDYAVMEKSDKIKVVPATFDWSDLGSFEAVYDYLRSKGHPVDADGNMVIGCPVSAHFVGMQNAIFVHTPDAYLILQKEASQDVKKLYEQLLWTQNVLI